MRKGEYFGRPVTFIFEWMQARRFRKADGVREQGCISFGGASLARLPAEPSPAKVCLPPASGIDGSAGSRDTRDSTEGKFWPQLGAFGLPMGL